MRTSGKSPYILIAERLGYEVAEKLMLGEPVIGEVAWEVKEVITSSLDYDIVYEDEEVGEGSECYAIVALIEGGYALSLIKVGERSQCKLVRAASNEEIEGLVKEAEKELACC